MSACYFLYSGYFLLIAVSEEDFGLSPTMIGGIIGGLLFLLVAITLAVIAVVCSKRRDRKRATKYSESQFILYSMCMHVQVSK